MFASRSDVAEELDRLDAHVTEVREALASGSPVGRRLDFLMQELQREANTLGRSPPIRTPAGPRSISRCSSSRCASRSRTSSDVAAK